MTKGFSLETLPALSDSYLLITNVYYSSLLGIFRTEFLRQCFKHHTGLNEIIKVDRARPSFVECSNDNLAKLWRPGKKSEILIHVVDLTR